MSDKRASTPVLNDKWRPKIGDRVRVKADADGEDAQYAGRRGTVTGLGRYVAVLLERRSEASYLEAGNLQPIKRRLSHGRRQ